MRSHEMIYVFSKAGANYYRKDVEGDFKPFISGLQKGGVKQYGGVEKIQKENDGSTRCIKSVIHNKTSSTRGGHPTEKPIDLYKFLIERYSNSGDTVLDPTFGSGNSGLACNELNRKYIGIEKDNNFFWKFVKKIFI
jgi:site-specific DNA-methyltransferase (adenine-specific)